MLCGRNIQLNFTGWCAGISEGCRKSLLTPKVFAGRFLLYSSISSDETNRQGRPFRPPPFHCSRRHFQEHHSRQEIEGSNTIGLLGTGKKLLVLKVMIMDDFSMEWWCSGWDCLVGDKILFRSHYKWLDDDWQRVPKCPPGKCTGGEEEKENLKQVHEIISACQSTC